MSHQLLAVRAILEFFKLADIAADQGGFWVSDEGGTKNVIAGEIARRTKCDYKETQKLLELIGGLWFVETCVAVEEGAVIELTEADKDCWYDGLRQVQGTKKAYNWEARTIATQACRAVLSTE
jgi:hypothetical protein